MDFYANLHTHTTHSDGKYTPAEIVKIAKDEGYKAIAVTDHDTATAYSELKAACAREGMECIFGVEFSTKQHPVLGVDFHMVGFHFDPEHPEMKEYLRRLSANETNQTKVLFHEGVKNGTITGITWEEVEEYNKNITWLCNEHVFRAMESKGLVTKKDFPQFYAENYYHCWERVEPLYPFKSLEDIISLVHDAGGITILAHPVGERISMLDSILKMGIDGVEVWHADMNDEERKIAYDFCTQHKLYISGGSDHSGLCGGLYNSYNTPEECPQYIPEMSCGVPKQFFDEIKNKKIIR